MDHNQALRTSVDPLPTDWNRVTGSGPLNLISHHSTLVCQPPIIERTIVKPGARSWERQRPSPDKPHDDDDDDDDDDEV